MTHLRHNLFRFATRELSHSAFWAWVLQSVDQGQPDMGGPERLGKRLLARLGAPSSPNAIQVQTERTLPHKAGRADIWATVDQEHIVVIENKRSSIPKRSQIERYRQALASESRTLHLGILSTSFDDDFRAALETEPGWHFVSAEDVLSMLNDCKPHDHPLIRDYDEWLRHVLTRREKNRKGVFSSRSEERVEALGTRVGQWELLGRLTKAMTGRMYRGTNTGGRPWTQFRFQEQGEDGSDALFYRVDRSVKGYYLSVRQYQSTPTPDWTTKKARLKALRDAWCQAVEEAGADLIFERPRNRGKKESEIAWLLFRRNAVSTVLEEFPKLHEVFLAQLSANPSAHGG